MRFDSCEQNTNQINQITEYLYRLFILHQSRRDVFILDQNLIGITIILCVRYNLVQIMCQLVYWTDQILEIHIQVAAIFGGIFHLKNWNICLVLGDLIDEFIIEHIL